MPRPILSVLAVLVALAVLAPAASGQDRSDLRRVVLTNGDVYVGTVADEAADPVVLTTEGGIEQRIPRAQIAEIGPLLDGRFSRYDPARTRLFFSPTARSLGSGNKRFSAYYLFPSIAVSVSERVDMSAGATIPFVSSDGAAIALNGNVKVTLTQSDGFATAVGGSALVPLSTEDVAPGIGGTVYGLATFGGEAGAVTIGAYGVYATDFESAEFGDGAALLLGLERQVSDRFKLISENYVFMAFGEGSAFGSLSGVRFFGDRLAADVAVALVAVDGDFVTIPIPYLGMSYTF